MAVTKTWRQSAAEAWAKSIALTTHSSIGPVAIKILTSSRHAKAALQLGPPE